MTNENKTYSLNFSILILFFSKIMSTLIFHTAVPFLQTKFINFFEYSRSYSSTKNRVMNKKLYFSTKFISLQVITFRWTKNRFSLFLILYYFNYILPKDTHEMNISVFKTVFLDGLLFLAYLCIFPT